MPVTVAEWSKAWTILARLDARIVVSNPTRGMDIYVYVYVYSMFVLACVDRADHSSKVSYRLLSYIKKLKWNGKFQWEP
jgi:hypothetical protein